MARKACLLALAFVRLVASQTIALQGRFLSLGSSQNASPLPTAVSWPASQISASFTGSSAVTAVVKDLTYAASSQLALLPAGVQLLVNGAGTAVVFQAQDMFYFTIGNLPGTSATVTLTKQDESVMGELQILQDGWFACYCWLLVILVASREYLLTYFTDRCLFANMQAALSS